MSSQKGKDYDWSAVSSLEVLKAILPGASNISCRSKAYGVMTFPVMSAQVALDG